MNEQFATIPDIAVVVAAGGSGCRFGSNKLLSRLAGDGEPIFARCLGNILGAGVRLVVSTKCRCALEGLLPPQVEVLWAPGGASRSESVWNGLCALVESGNSSPWIAVHDAARPLATYGLLLSCWHRLVESGADGVVPVHPVADTIHCVSPEGELLSTPARPSLRGAETPQVFRREVLIGAYTRWHDSPGDFSDDASLVRALLPQSRILLLENSSCNRKITYPEDCFLGFGAPRPPMPR